MTRYCHKYHLKSYEYCAKRYRLYYRFKGAEHQQLTAKFVTQYVCPKFHWYQLIVYWWNKTLSSPFFVSTIAIITIYTKCFNHCLVALRQAKHTFQYGESVFEYDALIYYGAFKITVCLK